MLTAYPYGFKAGLIFQEVKGAFTVFANIMCLFYRFDMPGNPLEQAAVDRDKPTLWTGSGYLTITAISAAFLFMPFIGNAQMEHGNRTLGMAVD